MKKVIKGFLIFLLMFPFVINAIVCSEDNKDKISKVIDNYLNGPSLKNTHSNYFKNSNQLYNNLLDQSEFDASLNNGNSYLSDGYNYCLKNSENKIINNDNKNSKVRIVEELKPEVKVNGLGSYERPWIFTPNYLINITSNEYGKISDETKNKTNNLTLNVINNEELRIYLFPNSKYKYIKNTCGFEYVKDGSEIYLKTAEIESNLKCNVYFAKGTYKVDLVDTNKTYKEYPNPRSLYLLPDVGWYSDENLTNLLTKISIPAIKGYKFIGYENNKNIKFIDSKGNLTSKNNSDFDSSTQAKLLIEPIKYTIEYKLSNGTSILDKTTCEYDKDCTLKTYSPGGGNSFKGWNTKSDGKGTMYYTDSLVVKNLSENDGDKLTLYAQVGLRNCNENDYVSFYKSWLADRKEKQDEIEQNYEFLYQKFEENDSLMDILKKERYNQITSKALAAIYIMTSGLNEDDQYKTIASYANGKCTPVDSSIFTDIIAIALDFVTNILGIVGGLVGGVVSGAVGLISAVVSGVIGAAGGVIGGIIGGIGKLFGL